MDIFVEPVLPRPSLVILGASPVALSLAAQARQLGYHVTLAAPAADPAGEPEATCLSMASRRAAQRRAALRGGFDPGQGRRGRARAAVAVEADYHAFVGSRRKMVALRDKLVAGGIAREAIDRVKAPAGLDLGAITPEEIAIRSSPKSQSNAAAASAWPIPLPADRRLNHADERQPAHSRVEGKGLGSAQRSRNLKQYIPGCQSLEM